MAGALRALGFVLLLVATSSASAGESTWILDAQAESASLARTGWKFLDSTGLSWPDGRQAIVTFWQSSAGDVARCIDYYDSNMQASGSICYRSGVQK
jgi:hypothetical protein